MATRAESLEVSSFCSQHLIDQIKLKSIHYKLTKIIRILVGTHSECLAAEQDLHQSPASRYYYGNDKL